MYTGRYYPCTNANNFLSGCQAALTCYQRQLQGLRCEYVPCLCSLTHHVRFCCGNALMHEPHATLTSMTFADACISNMTFRSESVQIRFYKQYLVT